MTILRRSVPVGPATRDILLQLPPDLSSPRPLVVVYHGAGATAAWMRDELRWGPFADAQGWVSAFPEGRPLFPGRPLHPFRNPQVWNDGSGQGVSATAGADDVAFFRALIDDAAAVAPVDRSRVYVTGFSNGAAFAFHLAATCADAIAAVCPVAAHCRTPDPRPARPVPTLFVIGDADPIVPLHGGDVVSPWTGKTERKPPVSDTLATWAAANGLLPTPTTAWDEAAATVAEYGAGEVRAVTVRNHGHHWPGGRGRLAPRFAGPAATGFDLNAALAAFVAGVTARGSR